MGKTVNVMKIYHVYNKETNYDEEFYNLSAAKKAMKENNARGSITKVWRNGDWENLGEIKLDGSNKKFITNTKQKKSSY